MFLAEHVFAVISVVSAVVHSDNLRHSEVSVWGLKLTLCFCFLSLRLTKGFLGTRDYQEGHRQTRVIWSPKCHVRHSASGWSNRRALEWRLCPSVAPTWDREDGLVSLEAVIGQGQHGEVGGESSGTFFLCGMTTRNILGSSSVSLGPWVILMS